MRNVFFILVAFLMMACSNADFSKVEVGMTTNQVEKLVGKPNEKVKNILAHMWMYESHVLFFDADDKVSDVFTNEEYVKAFEESFDLDEFEDTLNEAVEGLTD